VANLALLSAHWDRRHAVADQLLRASESVVMNIGEGARLRNGPQRQHILDYAIGSASECAACLDIAQCNQWLLQSEANTYIQLSQRTGEMSVETAQCGLELFGRVAVLTRGLAENT
jgi:four helix bundle protein